MRMNCRIELIGNKFHLMHRQDSWEDLEDTAHNVGKGDGHVILMNQSTTWRRAVVQRAPDDSRQANRTKMRVIQKARLSISSNFFLLEEETIAGETVLQSESPLELLKCSQLNVAPKSCRCVPSDD